MPELLVALTRILAAIGGASFIIGVWVAWFSQNEKRVSWAFRFFFGGIILLLVLVFYNQISQDLAFYGPSGQNLMGLSFFVVPCEF